MVAVLGNFEHSDFSKSSGSAQVSHLQLLEKSSLPLSQNHVIPYSKANALQNDACSLKIQPHLLRGSRPNTRFKSQRGLTREVLSPF